MMERLLKFRAWHKKSKQMFTSTTINSNLLIGLNGALKEVYLKEDVTDEFVLMQYTGLKDKNDKEIYEGDIIGRELVGGEFEIIGRVIYDDDFGSFCISYENGGWAYLGQHMVVKKTHRKEVIGNIYENKELINEGE